MSIKRKPVKPVDIKKAEAIIHGVGEGTSSVPAAEKEQKVTEKKKVEEIKTLSKDRLITISQTISERAHNTLREFALEKRVNLYEVYNYMALYFTEDLSRFDGFLNIKRSEVTLYNYEDGWKIECPLCKKESAIKDPDGAKFIKFKKEHKVDCPKCNKTLHIAGIEM